jgi:soluble lytic murein transglycosylase-like protein
MKKVFMVRCVLFVVSVFVVLNTASVVHAEPERYDFPVFKRKEEPIKLIFPKMPALAVQQDARKSNEAKRKSIAALLQQYNKKLNDTRANDYAVFIMQASEKFGQDPFVIAAMVVNESSAKHDAVSRGGDYGLMQVRWRVHQKKIRKKYPHIENAKDILNPQDNVLVGTEIFSTYHATADKDVKNAVMYYSAGNKRLVEKVFAVLSKLEKSYLENLKNS